jgi:hypothetical protein
MSLRFSRLDRLAIRTLRSGEKITEQGIKRYQLWRSLPVEGPGRADPASR